jgi:hypothetical protein
MISPTRISPSTDLFAAPLEGMRMGAQQLDEISERIADGDTSADKIAGQMQAEFLIKANAVSLRMADEVVGSLLNEKA